VAGADDLAILLTATAEAHHATFSATDGDDPEWPAWYARHLLDNGFEEIVGGRAVSVDELADLLKDADRRHRAEIPQPEWGTYYADLIRTRLR
jgi:hypothetical protein